MTFDKFMERVKQITKPPKKNMADVLAAIENETEVQVLTQALDVAKGDWRRAAIRRRIATLTGVRRGSTESVVRVSRLYWRNRRSKRRTA